MAEVKWIKVTTNVFEDDKILLIESMPDADSLIVIWFKLLTLAGKLNDGGVLRMSETMPYTEEMLSVVFRRPLNTVRLALQTFESFGMIENINGTYVITNWEKHQSEDKLKEIREQNRQRQAKHRARRKQALLTSGEEESNVTRNVTITSRNALDTEQEQERDIDTESSCSKGTDVWRALTPDEVDALYGLYINAGDLIQEVYEDAKLKHRIISNVYNYICGYAKNKEWPHAN